jgi:hypothetical protein
MDDRVAIEITDEFDDALLRTRPVMAALRNGGRSGW